MAFTSFEVERLLFGSREEAATQQRRYSRFPRTARMRSLLLGVAALSAIAFGLNMFESSRIPTSNGLKHGETKKSKNDNGGDDDDHAVVSAPWNGQPQTSATLSPTQRPTMAPNLRPTGESSNISQPAEVPSLPATDNLTTPGGQLPALVDPSIPNQVPDFAYPEASIPVMSNASQAFVERWCDLEGTDWYPKGENAWKLRAPAFLIPGAKYSGIFAITKLLDEHPQIRPPSKGPETKFFFEPDFLKYVKSNEKTTVMQARERLLAGNYPPLEFRNVQGRISYDASSGYLFRSTVLPRRLLCVLPWIKIVAVLRDPIERLYLHYLSMNISHSLPHALHDWIESDLEKMRRSGLIANATASSTITKNMTAEDIAWYEYQHSAIDGPVGRSLYDIQLRQWFQALRAIGRNPKDSVLIIRTEELADNPQREFDRMLKFLGLAKFTPSSWDIVSSISNNRSSEMSEETRKMLKDFFRPYEARLLKLLQRFKVPYGSGSINKASDKR